MQVNYLHIRVRVNLKICIQGISRRVLEIERPGHWEKIKVENIRSGKIIYVDKGETIISTRDGKFIELDTFKNSAKIIEHLEMH